MNKYKKRGMKRASSLYRPPLWFPMWIQEEEKKRKNIDAEELSEFEKDKELEMRDHMMALRESAVNVKRVTTPNALFRQARKQTHMRLNRRVSEQPDLFPSKPDLYAPQPNRIIGERYTPLTSSFVPLSERIEMREKFNAKYQELLSERIRRREELERKYKELFGPRSRPGNS